MDIKYKKLILLVMEMNNANHLKMKFTNTKIVNKEIFTQINISLYYITYLHGELQNERVLLLVVE